jgi:hypothetical protein
MPNIYPKDAGTFAPAKEVFVKDADVWKTVKEVYVNVSGTWTKAFPESTGTQSYSTPGVYDFTVPNGVYLLYNVIVVGGGGGGGGSVHSGDSHGAANGGSGGYYSGQSVSVTPGQVYTIVVGSGGEGVSSGTGGGGGASFLYRGATNIFVAFAGTGGAGTFGDNAPAFGGTGGSPSGANGSYTAYWMIYRNTPGQGYDGGGQNGTGFGDGGLGGNRSGGSALGVTGLPGGAGYVSLSW